MASSLAIDISLEPLGDVATHRCVRESFLEWAVGGFDESKDRYI